MLAVASQPASQPASRTARQLKPKPRLKPERHARLLHVMVRNPARNASVNPAHLSIWPRPDGWCRRCMGERCQGPAAIDLSVHGDIDRLYWGHPGASVGCGLDRGDVPAGGTGHAKSRATL